MGARVYFNRFFSKIDGKGIYDYTQLDTNIDDLEGRLKYIYDLLNVTKDENGIEFSNDEFWNEIFIQRNNKTSYIDLCPNTETELYSDSNVAKTLEMLSNYILWCDPNKKEKSYIKIYDDEKKFRDALYKEKKYIEKYGERLEEGIALLRHQKNYKKAKDEVVTSEDLKKYPELMEYKKEIDRLSAYIKENRLDEFVEYMQKKGHKKIKTKKQAKSFLTNHIGLLKKDMLQCKIELVRPIVWKQPLKDEGCPDWNEFDELDNSQIKALLQLYKESEVYDFQDDLGCMFQDLENVLRKIKLTDKQREVLELWKSGMTIKNIAKELNKKPQAINQMLDTVVNKIVQVYEEQLEDWYYLNICKGEYKKCNKCGEIKLINKFNKNGKGGVRNMCKICQ